MLSRETVASVQPLQFRVCGGIAAAVNVSHLNAREAIAVVERLLLGIAALTGPQDSVEERRAAYERRRDLARAVLDGLETRSEGTFFVWFRLPPGVTVEELLVRHRVALAPGEGFGQRGAGWARLSLAVADETLEVGLERLRLALFQAA